MDYCITDHDIKFEVLYKNRSLLVKQKEGEVYLTSDNDKKYVLKKRDICSKCLRHEFSIGSKLNTLNNIHLVRYIAYIPHVDGSSFVLMEYAEGTPLASLYKNLPPIDTIFIFYHIILILADLQGKIKFTHYDLHMDNIIVKVGINRRYAYKCFGKEYKILSPYEIKIIDFGNAYCEGVKDDWVDVNVPSIVHGMIPSVYDDFYDICYITSILFDMLDIPDMEYIADRDRISNLQEKNSFSSANLSDTEYHGREMLRSVYYLQESKWIWHFFKFFNMDIIPRAGLKELVDEFGIWASNRFQDIDPDIDQERTIILDDRDHQLVDTYLTYISIKVTDLKTRAVKDRTVSIQEYFDVVISSIRRILSWSPKYGSL